MWHWLCVSARVRAETEPHGPVFKIHNQKTRYIYDLFYRRKATNWELNEYCLREKIADSNLIAK
ncbi:GL20292 [Drosophila persimilis]|uniref:GL20292 n=1 Tax=Drosophila persimilis TaxID=7234 RepID=B4GXJ5_DROPE|nr:GL20292 [Drosophila persimilis]